MLVWYIPLGSDAEAFLLSGFGLWLLDNGSLSPWLTVGHLSQLKQIDGPVPVVDMEKLKIANLPLYSIKMMASQLRHRNIRDSFDKFTNYGRSKISDKSERGIWFVTVLVNKCKERIETRAGFNFKRIAFLCQFREKTTNRPEVLNDWSWKKLLKHCKIPVQGCHYWFWVLTI